MSVVSLYEKKLENIELDVLVHEAVFCGALMEKSALTGSKLTPSEYEWCRAVFTTGVQKAGDIDFGRICSAALKVLPYVYEDA